MTNKPLTAAQEKFCRGIVGGLSQTEAYRQAYPRSTKWKVSAVHVAGSMMAAREKVAGRIAELTARVTEEFIVDSVATLREASRLANSDVRQLFGEDGRVLLPREIPTETARAIASFEIDEYGRIKYKFWDKNAALEKLFKHKGLFAVDNKQKTDPVVELLASLSGHVLRPVDEP